MVLTVGMGSIVVAVILTGKIELRAALFLLNGTVSATASSADVNMAIVSALGFKLTVKPFVRSPHPVLQILVFLLSSILPVDLLEVYTKIDTILCVGVKHVRFHLYIENRKCERKI